MCSLLRKFWFKSSPMYELESVFETSPFLFIQFVWGSMEPITKSSMYPIFHPSHRVKALSLLSGIPRNII